MLPLKTELLLKQGDMDPQFVIGKTGLTCGFRAWNTETKVQQTFSVKRQTVNIVSQAVSVTAPLLFPCNS